MLNDGTRQCKTCGKRGRHTLRCTRYARLRAELNDSSRKPVRKPIRNTECNTCNTPSPEPAAIQVVDSTSLPDVRMPDVRPSPTPPPKPPTPPVTPPTPILPRLTPAW